MLQIDIKGYGVKFTNQVFLLTSIDTKVTNVTLGEIDIEHTSFGELLKYLVHEIAVCLKQ